MNLAHAVSSLLSLLWELEEKMKLGSISLEVCPWYEQWGSCGIPRGCIIIYLPTEYESRRWLLIVGRDDNFRFTRLSQLVMSYIKEIRLMMILRFCNKISDAPHYGRRHSEAGGLVLDTGIWCRVRHCGHRPIFGAYHHAGIEAMGSPSGIKATTRATPVSSCIGTG